ncbi:MAG: ABC-F family ATP-binding cassette domain-containing protein [Coriobacteriia bacterium]|nr:ABC-F family ATP-binding cassette domain-containing protein [Coriobacteriia bacterium]
MTAPLIAKDLSLVYPTKRIFDTITLSVDSGSRIGIVGKNGGGKSSLLRLLAGDLKPDAGEVTKRSDVTVGILHQKDSLDCKATALEAATEGVATHEWAANRMSREIIETLLAGIKHHQLVGQLSGGQRRRVDLARILIQSWDILMLDEPTNHLDIQTIFWLAKHLKKRWLRGSGSLLLVTHDRWFIDEVCTSMWEVHDEGVRSFDGGYSAYILQRVERDRLQQLAEDKRQNLLRKELAWLSRGARARATKPKFHLKIAHELIEGEPPPRDMLELKRAAMTRLGKQVLEFCGVSATLGTKELLREVDFLIGPGDRLAIMGGNGTGKTTLLRLLTGELSPTSGYIKRGKTVHMAYLSQQLEELEGMQDWRVLEVLDNNKRGVEIDGKYVSSTELLSRLGFEKSYLRARINDLSGGQRRRLQLLLTLLAEPNVLLLDEPGNDFDTDMLTVLEDLLDTWPGTLILVSHDRYLVERVTDMQYALIDGKLRHLPGGVDEYLEGSGGGDRGAALLTPPATTLPASNKESLPLTPAPLAPTKLSGSELHEARKQLASTERKIRTTEQQIEAQAALLHSVDPTDYLALGQAQSKLNELKSRLQEFELVWLTLSERLER